MGETHTMPKILLVDDEPSIRFSVSEFLRRAGYDAVAAADYDAALANFDAGDFDAAVIDIVLPRKSGVLLLEELHRRMPDLPVVMMTGEPNIMILPEIVRAGAYDFLTKPVTKDVLLRAVARAVERKRLSDEKHRLEQELVRHAEELEEAIATRTTELVEARNFLKAVVDSPVEYALVVTDTEGRVTLFNRGAELMFRQATAEARGRPARELIGEGTDSARADATRAEIATEGVRGTTSEIVARRADDTCFVASLSITPVRAAGGQLLGHLAVVKDLTAERERAAEMNRMRDRLTQNEKIAALGRMAAQVAHEVRNPLTGLRLYAMHLRGKLGDRFTTEETALCEKILLSIDHLSNTTEQILNVARPIKLVLAPRRVEPLVGDVLQLLDSQLRVCGVEVRLDFNDEVRPALIDEASMRSALVNLLLNAVQSMPTGGTLSITARADGDSLLVEIGDTGSGMTPEQSAQVFEPFYTTKTRGLGLGMPYAKRVIEEHGGAIRLESEPGAGTKVEIRLPLTEANSDAV
ncbi:MAG: two-component system, chemotaxis family, CheB/CheR fusion protein [Acidobacteriota bacterium]|jgi:PAS domain S-box-containing protein|nr:two-component system, chemotaxis family, CheB/CheR fusion protein [Acidobacteriota bacterium]